MANNRTSALQFPMMVVHLLKVTAHGKVQVLIDTMSYLFGLLRWRISAALIKPLNYLRETELLTAFRKQVCMNYFAKDFIRVPLPANLEPPDTSIFTNNYYLLHPLKIVALNDSWIYLTNYHGIVFKGFAIQQKSIHGKWDKRNVDLLKEYYPLVFKAWLYARHERNGNLTELSAGKRYLLCHHWFNYYHWMTETVLRLWLVKDRINDYTVLLPESFREIKFVQQSLDALNVKEVQYLKGGIVHASHLTLVENKPYCNHYYPERVKQIGMFFRDYVKNMRIEIPDFGDKIFISRKKADRRKMVNEEEVFHLLSSYGFSSVVIEDFDFFQEVTILSKAKYLIGMHGAGLTNMMFMPKGGRVLEFHREIYSNDDLHSDVYWKLASALGHQYYYQFCEPSDKDEDFFTTDYIVDTEKLSKNLKSFLA